MLRTGGKVLVDQLALHGAELAFCVPGESYLAVLDALHDAPIRLVTCRHEAAAANMAEAYGKLTGRPGICLVTRGPGATHASIGVHTAYQDSTPLILLVGQVGRDMLEREAFQEIDYRRMFNSMAKWVVQIESAERIPELLARAFSVATAGRPGPVVLALPEDMLVDEVDVADPGPYRPVHTHPGADELERLRELLDASERPLAIVGGGKWSAQAAEDTIAFCEANELPVATSFRRQDYVDNRSRVFAGHVGVGIDPALATRVTEADLLLVVGPRLGEMTTGGYTLVEPPLPRQTLVHVHAGAEELGRVYQPALAIHAGSPEFAAAAREACVSETQSPSRRAWVEAARADYLKTLEPVPSPGALNLSEVMVAAARAAAGGRDHLQRRGQLRHLAAPVLAVHALPQPARADERGDGLRRPGRDRSQDRPPGADRGLLRRRRRLPDERPGARDRGAGAGGRALPRRRQRDVRDHPHAPGA